MAKHRSSTGLFSALAFITSILVCTNVHPGTYIFAGESYGADLVTHPSDYNGTGGTLTVRVCIDPTSTNASSMELSVKNIINEYNRLQPTTGNLQLGGSNNIASNEVDFESVALHEIGHCIGMAHVNAASGSGLIGSNQNYTKATDGANNTFNINPGADGIIGSSDDVRGDDVNMHWFQKGVNNPFTIATTVDSSTYSINLAHLPTGHNFAVNADRTVAGTLGAANTEAVMQQGSFYDEAQRLLTHDDVATLRYAASGLDENADTGDDYTIQLEYGGVSTSNCDVKLDFDNDQTGFAVCGTSGWYVPGSSDHFRIIAANIYFNTGFNWFYNNISNNQSPVLAAIGDQPLNEGDSLSVSLSASNPDNDNQSFSVSGLPGFAALTDHGYDMATLDIDPLAGDAGTYTVTITVTDGALPAQSDNETFDIIVSAPILDSDGDGLSDATEAMLGTNPNNADTDGDGLADGTDGIVLLAAVPGGIDADGDGYVDGEQDLGTDPLTSNIGDLAPRGSPNDLLDAGDLVVLTRLVTGVITTPTALELALADINGDSLINAADLLLLQQILLAAP